MLSPAGHHRSIPRDPLANLAWRVRLLDAIAEEGEAGRRAVIQACSEDCLFFINSFGWQFNPLKKGTDRVGPFVTWDFQEESLLARPETHDGRRGILWGYENNRSVVIEKSREMGGTWVVLYVEAWLSLFHDYSQWLNISRSADAVDDNTPHSLFAKIRFINRHLPEWLRGPVTEQKMHIHYGRTESDVVGEASTGRAGVSGRAGGIFVDEVTKIREAREVRQRTASTADFRIFVSTHEGSDTEFYDLTQTPEFIQLCWHWSQHPLKKRGAYRFDPERPTQPLILDKTYEFPEDYQFVLDGTPTGGPHPGLRSPWYDWKCKDIGDARGIAVELDINPEGSVSQFFNAMMIARLIEEACCDPYWEGYLEYDKEKGIPHHLVPQEGGPIRLWLNLSPEGKPPTAYYVAGSDVSTGEKVTPSCLSICNSQTGEKVMECARADMRPEPWAKFCVAVCRLFKDRDGQPAILGWEVPGPGLTFGQVVYESGYRNVLFQTPDDAPARRFEPIDKPGWVCSHKSKAVLLSEYQHALAEGMYVNRSKLALKECTKFMYNRDGAVVHTGEVSDNDPSGSRMNHGDRTIADAISWRIAKLRYKGPGPKRAEPEVPYNSLAHRRLLRQNQRDEANAWA